MPKALNLNDLAAGRNPGVTAEKGAELAQAGAICLESRGHNQETPLAVRGDFDATYQLTWTPVTQQARRTWDDDDEATEDGAAGISTLLANREIGQMVVLRARKSSVGRPTGFDYWLGDDRYDDMTEAERFVTESLADILADSSLVVRTRMEVSGIRNGNDAKIRARVGLKLNQMRRSDSFGLPAYAMVVEFGRPVAEIRKR